MNTDAEKLLGFRRIKAEFLKGTPPAEALEILARMIESSDAVRDSLCKTRD
jgi:hypothetical protein